MDRLSKRALRARELGMTYGKYIAKYHPPKPEPERYVVRKKVCILCGAKLEGRQIKYCLACRKQGDKLNKGMVGYRQDSPIADA